MKKIFIVIVTITFSTGVFAQGQTERKSKPPVAGTEEKMTDMTHCYAMKDGVMIHCMGTKTEPMKKNIISRRNFLQSAALATGITAISPFAVAGDLSPTKKNKNKSSHGPFIFPEFLENNFTR
jgi:hypothetical protein